MGFISPYTLFGNIVRRHHYNNGHGIFTMHHVPLLDIKMHDGFGR
jgi:hypothetical protein